MLPARELRPRTVTVLVLVLAVQLPLSQAGIPLWGQKSPDTPGSPEGNTEGPGTLAPQLEKTHKIPPSSRDEGFLFLHGRWILYQLSYEGSPLFYFGKPWKGYALSPSS